MSDLTIPERLIEAFELLSKKPFIFLYVLNSEKILERGINAVFTAMKSDTPFIAYLQFITKLFQFVECSLESNSFNKLLSQKSSIFAVASNSSILPNTIFNFSCSPIILYEDIGGELLSHKETRMSKLLNKSKAISSFVYFFERVYGFGRSNKLTMLAISKYSEDVHIVASVLRSPFILDLQTTNSKAWEMLTSNEFIKEKQLNIILTAYKGFEASLRMCSYSSRRTFFELFFLKKWVQVLDEVSYQLSSFNERKSLDNFMLDCIEEFRIGTNHPLKDAIVKYFRAYIRVLYEEEMIEMYLLKIITKAIEIIPQFDTSIRPEIPELKASIQIQTLPESVGGYGSLYRLPNNQFALKGTNLISLFDDSGESERLLLKLRKLMQKNNLYFRPFRTHRNDSILTTIEGRTEDSYEIIPNFFQFKRNGQLSYLGRYNGLILSNDEIFGDIESQIRPRRKFFIVTDFKHSPTRKGRALLFDTRTKKLLKILALPRSIPQPQFNHYVDFKLVRFAGNEYYVCYHSEEVGADKKIFGIMDLSGVSKFQTTLKSTYSSLSFAMTPSRSSLLLCASTTIQVLTPPNFTPAAHSLCPSISPEFPLFPPLHSVHVIGSRGLLIVPKVSSFLYFFDEKDMKIFRIFLQKKIVQFRFFGLGNQSQAVGGSCDQVFKVSLAAGYDDRG